MASWPRVMPDAIGAWEWTRGKMPRVDLIRYVVLLPCGRSALCIQYSGRVHVSARHAYVKLDGSIYWRPVTLEEVLREG